MRKKLFTGLIITMTILTLTGCGNKKEDVVTVTDSTTTVTESVDTVEDTKETETEEVVTSETPTSEPTEEVKETEVPVVETEAPTQEPKVTESPDEVEVTAAPEITKAPEEAEATKEPAKETEAPTVAPGGTEAPAETPKPTDTPKPTEAPTPKPTDAPTPTEVPATPVPTPEPTPEPVCDHELENKTIKEPTCSEYGEFETVCSKCGYSWGIGKSPLVDHQFVNGVCTFCQHTDETAHKHDWVLTATISAPTCGKVGDGAYECSSCHATKADVIPATEQHIYTLLFRGCKIGRAHV